MTSSVDFQGNHFCLKLRQSIAEFLHRSFDFHLLTFSRRSGSGPAYTPTGADIPIEERHEDEVLYVWGWSDDGRFVRVRTAPAGSRGRNPAFDVTPAGLITGIITERGIVPATPEGIASVARR
jgi:hypothetical protein